MDDKTLKHWASGPLCTITQAAALLGVSSQTVRRMVMHGSLIAWRPNRPEESGCSTVARWRLWPSLSRDGPSVTPACCRAHSTFFDAKCAKCNKRAKCNRGSPGMG